MELLLAPELPLFDFLGPFELLKLLHVSKAAHRGAALRLQKWQASFNPSFRANARVLSNGLRAQQLLKL